jgi:predicted RNA methylase
VPKQPSREDRETPTQPPSAGVELAVRSGLAEGARAACVGAALRRGEIPPDADFDRFLPSVHQGVSPYFWTPLAVVARISSWFRDLRVSSVVDIGSGTGKFCVAGALATRCRFAGLEHRPALVGAARALADTFGVGDRVTFSHGAFGERPVPEADAYYLYNPFGENLFGRPDQLDAVVELSDARYRRDVSAVEAFLEDTRPGSYLVTYNGFGGDPPPSYEGLFADWSTPSLLRLFRKRDPTA